MHSLILLASLLMPLSLIPSHGVIVPRASIMTPADMGDCCIYFMDDDYYLNAGGKTIRIERWDLDATLRSMDSEKLTKFLDNGYIHVNKTNQEGVYSVRAKVRGNGGGPGLAAVGWTVVQLVGWSVPALVVKQEISDMVAYGQSMWTADHERDYQNRVFQHEQKKRVELKEIMKSKPYMNNITPTVIPANTKNVVFWDKVDTNTEKVVYGAGINLNFPKDGPIPESSYSYDPHSHVGVFERVDNVTSAMVSNRPEAQLMRVNAMSGLQYIANRGLNFSLGTSSGQDLSMNSLQLQRAVCGSIALGCHIREKVYEPIKDTLDMITPSGLLENIAEQTVVAALQGQKTNPKEVAVAALAAGVYGGGYKAAVDMVATKVFCLLMAVPGW
jgi:hypothetical protein